MANIDKYTGLVTSEHRDKPLFISVLSTLLGGLVDTINAADSLPDAFDVDTAVGVQLDAIGVRVGISRVLRVPIVGIYFEWDGTPEVGWDAGIWRGPFDPTSGLTSLPDDIYRRLIRAKIAANNWDGTIPGAMEVWAIAFDGAQTIIIQDNQDMSMIVGLVGTGLSTAELALLTGGYLPLKPAGVRVSYYAVPVGPGPLFAWDVQNESLDGWDTGSWAKEITPI